MKRGWWRFCGFVALVGVLSVVPGFAWAADNVLILNSYHRGKLLSDETIDAIVADMARKRPDVTFLIEDMDTKRHAPEALSATLLSAYTQKYRGVKLSAVITVDNNAFDFALANRAALFPNVPLIFCSLNGFQPSLLDGVEGVTGVAEVIDIEATVQVALDLHPGTTHLAVVSDFTPSGRAVLDEFRQFATQLPDSIRTVELAELTAIELTAGLKSLPPTSVVLRLAYFRDPNGQYFRLDEQVELLTAPGLPVYDFWDESIGSGYVGGYVLTGANQGQVVAQMLERVLAGESPEQIAVVDRSPKIPVFDKRALLRSGADMSALPANAVLRFNEVPFWELYRGLLVIIGSVFFALLGLAVYFAVLSVHRKRLGLALSHEEQKLRATLQSIGEGVVTTNTLGEIEHMNSVAEQWLGLTLEQAMGKPVADVFQLREESNDALIEWPAGDDFPSTVSALLMTSERQRLPIVLTAAPVVLPPESKTGTVIVFRDMSRENELQREVQQVRRLDALGQLAGGVAHDFNNMLGGIVGAAEILNDELDDDSELSELPELILGSAHRAAELTAQLLSFAREQPVAQQQVEVHQIIADTVGVLKRTIDPRIEMSVKAEADVDLVRGDRALLQSCLLNLGINASHAMPVGGTLSFSTQTVCLEPEDCEESSFELSAGDYIELRVEDSGSGIAPEVIERIFEPFFTTKGTTKGTGLGLAAVFGTVQQHNGSVTVRSELGRGTRFSIRLPLVHSAVLPLKIDEDVVDGEGLVLVVDDQSQVLDVTRRTLESLGYEVLTANNGLEAVELYEREQQRIDAVLLDMVMPKMSGRDCFVELRRLNPQICVIATSGYAASEDLDEMKRLGLAMHLVKPYPRAELGRAMRDVLQLCKDR